MVQKEKGIRKLDKDLVGELSGELNQQVPLVEKKQADIKRDIVDKVGNA
jgi:hypothetical protein|tara:strand:- start:3176 stop:3322 length:147 start_codon:yes stop_codon:yes gene_type:complete